MLTIKEVSYTLHIAEIISIKLENSSRATEFDKSVCTFSGFGWDALIFFFLSSCNGGVFWTCHENDDDNSRTF